MKVQRRSLLLGLSTFVASLFFNPSPAVSAFCDWQGQALADVFGGFGSVSSSHFGRLTNVNCSNSRKIILRANTLVNGGLLWEWDEIGGDAILGAHVEYEIGFMTCSGTWSSTSRFGTRYLGVNFWLNSDISNLLVATCGGLDEDPGPKPGDCSAGFQETSTWTLAAERDPALADEQLGFGLSREVERPEGHFLMDEWVLVMRRGQAPRLGLGSTAAFQDRVQAMLDRVPGRRQDQELILVVEAGDHPVDSRYIPRPEVEPLEVAVDWPMRSAASSFWFRAEVAADRAVDRVRMLHSSDSRGGEAVRAAIRENLRLRYADARRHRVVVFGRARVDSSGLLTVQDELVVLPQCCCGTDEAICI